VRASSGPAWFRGRSFARPGQRRHDTRSLQAYPGHANIQHTVRYTELSTRPYTGLLELDYPFHDKTVTVTTCGRLCFNRQKINLSTVFAGQKMGIMYRGFDLLLQNNGELLNLIGLAVLVLEWLCDPNERKDLIAQAFVLNKNIEHAAVRGGTAAAASELQVKGAFGHFEGKLKSGRDYTGEGNREVPFRLRSHLQFHQASRILLQQMNVEWTHRQLKRGADGRFCDCYQAGDREWWFTLPDNSPV
jgi:hypothetical protein